MPLFDGGRRRASVDAAHARYDEATSHYRARLREAIREVEEALITLQSAADRSDDAQKASTNYQIAVTAAQDRSAARTGSMWRRRVPAFRFCACIRRALTHASSADC